MIDEGVLVRRCTGQVYPGQYVCWSVLQAIDYRSTQSSGGVTAKGACINSSSAATATYAHIAGCKHLGC
jgi:hypothetical protein